MTGHPVFMIRRGDMKYIHCDSDPPQLFDIVNDPWELNNLVNLPAYITIADGFAKEVSLRWNSPTLRQKVINSQKIRFALNAAMLSGASMHWDYNPPSDATHQYVRNHMDWTVAAERFRFPPLD